ncbi:MAG TPA: efflux RND transporter periplasmic adaptor subunit [Gemmatimonadales bacterium]|jgi:HlyD family secretion protein
MTRRVRILIVIAVLALAAIGYALTHRAPAVLSLAGVVDADEVVVTPSVQGRIDTLTVVEGAVVHAGDLLAVLDQSELAAQAAAAGASAAGVRAQVAQATVNAEQAAGEAVGAQASARAHQASARADVTRQQALLEQLRTQATRSLSLHRNGAISDAELEQDTVAVRVQDQVLAAARETARAADAEVVQATAGALAATAAKRTITMTQAQLRGAQADSSAARTRLGYAELRAPSAGVVQVLVARLGELVGPGSPVAVIVDPNKLWVRVAAPESSAGAVAVGDSLTVRFPSGLTTRGAVLSKSVVADFATQHDVSATKRDIRAVAFKVTVPNPRHELVPGMSAEVLLPTRAP